MKSYMVSLESGQRYRFSAEDEAHAREQAESAEPDEAVASVIEDPQYDVFIMVDGNDEDATYWTLDVFHTRDDAEKFAESLGKKSQEMTGRPVERLES